MSRVIIIFKSSVMIMNNSQSLQTVKINIKHSARQLVDDEPKLLEVNAKLPKFDITFRDLQMLRDYEEDANT